jgi:hypothetical protein
MTSSSLSRLNAILFSRMLAALSTEGATTQGKLAVQAASPEPLAIQLIMFLRESKLANKLFVLC